MNRAYSMIEMKAVDEARRMVFGTIAMLKPDNEKDLVDVTGIKAAQGMPLLLNHDSDHVIGRATFGKAAIDGIPFQASLPMIMQRGALRDQVEEAWRTVKYSVTTGVAFGLRPVTGKVKQLDTGGKFFVESELVELSLVPLSSQAASMITRINGGYNQGAARSQMLHEIKSADQAFLRSRVLRFGQVKVDAYGERKKGVVHLNDGKRAVLVRV